MLTHHAHQRPFKSTEVSLPTLPIVSVFLDDLRATRCLLVTRKAKPKFNSLVMQGKTHFKLDSRKWRQILERKSVATFPVCPMSRLGLEHFSVTNGRSSSGTVCTCPFGFTYQDTFSCFSYLFFFKVNIYHRTFKSLSQKAIVL